MEEINWRDKPICATRWSDDATHILYIDENGHSNLKNIINCFEKRIPVQESEKYFNICGVLIAKEEHSTIAKSLVEIKHKYWPNGIYLYNGIEKTVFLHSEEIRKQKGPFGKSQIDQESFFQDLNKSMSEMNAIIFDCFINKDDYFKKYYYSAKDVYSLGIEYILERVVNRINDKSRVMIVCESRGAKEDPIVLETIKLLMAKGTYFVSDKRFSKITGIYFNPKRSVDYSKAYIGLEIADLCAYPIYKYCRYGTKDKSFEIIEKKLHGFPLYEGRGLKYSP